MQTRPCPTFGRPVHHGFPHRLRPGTSPHALRIPSCDTHLMDTLPSGVLPAVALAPVFDTIQCSLYSLRPEAYWKLGCFRGRVMYNVDLVRNLCKTITREKDARKSSELLALLRAVMREDQEQIPVR